VLIRRFPLAHETNRAIPSPSGSGPPQRPGCRVCDLSWLPSLLPRWRRLTLPSKPYDDRRNAVKEKGRFAVPAEGRGVHPAACPVDNGHGHRRRARRGHEEQVAARRRPERHSSPPGRACVRPRYSFLVGGRRRGNVRASPVPYPDCLQLRSASEPCGHAISGLMACGPACASLRKRVVQTGWRRWRRGARRADTMNSFRTFHGCRPAARRRPVPPPSRPAGSR